MARIRRTSAPAPHGASRTRMDQLDGLRVLAILSIVLYHLQVAWLPSGHLGVVMFFVLTGYVVTSTVARRKGEGSPAHELIGNFWLRRLKRIWPPMALMLLVVVVLCVVLNHVLLTKLRPDLLPALGLFENLSYILRDMSYFDALGAPSPATHLWYLGVDAQFCVVWPIVLVFLLDRDGRTGQPQRIFTLALALASAIAMAVLYRPGEDPSRVYYGPDTRAFSLLLGSWLALAWPMGEWPEWPLPSPSRRHDLAGVVALLTLVAMMALLPAQSAFLYYGGMLLASLLTVVLIAALLVPDGLLARLFALPPLAWVGRHSYGIYLWHYPLIILMGAQAFTSPIWVKVLAVALSCALAFGAEKLLAVLAEMGGPGDVLRGLLGSRDYDGAEVLVARIVAGGFAVMLAVSAIGLVVVPDETVVPEDAISSTGEAADHAMELEGLDEGLATGDEQPQDPSTIPSGQIVLRESSAAIRQGIYDPVIIGDSVIGDAADYVRRTCPTCLLDSYIGRAPSQSLLVLQDYVERGVAGNVVVLTTFSNLPAIESEVEELIAACGDRTVFIVNAYTHDFDVRPTNDLLAACADRHENVHIIDWYSAVNTDENIKAWLWGDYTHLTPDGAVAYVDLINNAIAREFVAAGGYAMTFDEYEAKQAESGETGVSTMADMAARNALEDVLGPMAKVSPDLTVDPSKPVEQTPQDEQQAADEAEAQDGDEAQAEDENQGEGEQPEADAAA